MEYTVHTWVMNNKLATTRMQTRPNPENSRTKNGETLVRANQENVLNVRLRAKILLLFSEEGFRSAGC